MGLDEVTVGETFYVEFWATDSGESDPGILGAYVDLHYPGCLSVADEPSCSSLFNTLCDGTATGFVVDELGGSQFDAGGIGADLQWAKIGMVPFTAGLECEQVVITLQPAESESSAFNRGVVPTTDIGYESCDFQVVAQGCVDDEDCNDRQFCTGDETCLDFECQPGTPRVCDDGVACTDDSCDPTAEDGAGGCINFPNHLNCAIGGFCNGTETCDTELGCLSGTPPCDDIDDCCGATLSCDGPCEESDFQYRCVIVSAESTVDRSPDLPAGLDQVAVDDTFYVEFWATDSGDTNTGLTSAYADLQYPGTCVSVSEELFSCSSLFNLFCSSGTDEDGVVDELGGNQLASGVGAPGEGAAEGVTEWARIGSVAFTAASASECEQPVIFNLALAEIESAAFNRGFVDTADIDYGSCQLVIAPESCAGVTCDPEESCVDGVCVPQEPEGDPVAGEAYYTANNCAACHGADATEPPSLIGADATTILDKLSGVVSHVGGTFEGVSRQDALDLEAYFASLGS